MVKTEKKVHYIVEEPTEVCHHSDKNHLRRWRVYFNDLEYISADFVVISGETIEQNFGNTNKEMYIKLLNI